MALYNKELQKIHSVKFIDYIDFNLKSKIVEKNGKGKEYLRYSDALIFEGEYLKGRKNGKGKEYYKNGKLLFEGEYLNGKKWNGNGYNKNGNLEFQ